MTIMEFIQFVKEVTGLTVYPNEFPTNITTNPVVIVDYLSSNSEDKSGKTLEIRVEFTVRSTSHELGNVTITTLLNKLHNKTNTISGNYQVICVYAPNPTAYFLGKDGNKHLLHIVDFTVLVTNK